MWLAIGIVPLACLYVSAAAAPPAESPWPLDYWLRLTARSGGLALAVAALALVLGYVPGKVIGTARRGGAALACLALGSLVLPRHGLYYIWSMLMSPTTPVGRLLAEQPQDVIQAISTATTAAVLVLGYWPLAALVLAQGWRNMDRDVLLGAELEAGPWRRLVSVHLPMLARPLAVAMAACFVMVMAEYATFHLAGVETLGSQLSVLYAMPGGSAAAVARAAWPLAAIALAVAVMVRRQMALGTTQPPLDEPLKVVGRREWAVAAVLVAASLGAPLAILVMSMDGTAALGQFWRLQADGLANSLAAAVGAAALAIIAAAGILAIERHGRWGRAVGAVAGATALAATFLPGSLVGIAIIQAEVVLGLPQELAQGWWILSIGQAARFTGVALVVLALVRDDADRHFDEMAGVDGAGWWAAWRYVRWPRAWPLVVGGGLLVVMLSLTEVPATLLLLPPGSANFTERLLNQMHYARDQHVIASCLALAAVYLALVAAVVALVLVARARRGGSAPGGPAGTGGGGGQSGRPRGGQGIPRGDTGISRGDTGIPRGGGPVPPRAGGAPPRARGGVRAPHRATAVFPAALLVAAVAAAACAAGGCDGGGTSTAPEVVRIIGSSGRGPGEFLYPRAIDLDVDGSLYVIDRTGRMQHLAPDGAVLATINLSPTDKGFPTGLAVGPGGTVYVADTHNHRVAVYGPDGKMVREFGRFGTGDGEFIYPTDVAVGPDGRIFVSEYGGNDRISTWSADGRFLGSFGRVGEGQGELSRPSALAIDAARGILYVADACNHRIARYTLAGELVGYFGSVGSGRCEFRYPYGLALLEGGALAVCEFGNNRVQILSPAGECLRMMGGAGRQPGQLAYPWGIAAAGRRLYVVDSGNNRVQVWAW